jgi:hypothetical protein
MNEPAPKSNLFCRVMTPPAGLKPALNMPAIAGLIFGVATLQKEPGFFVAFLVQIVQQGRVGLAWKPGRQLVQPRK